MLERKLSTLLTPFLSIIFWWWNDYVNVYRQIKL